MNRMKALAQRAKDTQAQLKEAQEKRRKKKQMKLEERIKIKNRELALKRKGLKQKSDIKRLENELKSIQEKENKERMESARKAYRLVIYGSTKKRKS